MKLQGTGWSAANIHTLSLAFCCENTSECSNIYGIYSSEGLMLKLHLKRTTSRSWESCLYEFNLFLQYLVADLRVLFFVLLV